MPEPTAEEQAAAAAAAQNNTDPNASLLDGGEFKEPAAPAPKPEDDAKVKEAQAAEEKRLLDADEKTLNDADKAKRADLVKAKEDKRILDTPDDKLTDAEKTRKAELVKAKADAEKAKQGAPEKYADFKLPDGIAVDAEALTEFHTVAKELNLTQEKAQKLVDLQVKVMQKYADEMLMTFANTVTQWKKDSVAQIGPEYKKEMAYATKFINAFGDKDVRDVLNKTGISNHPGILKMLIAAGKAISEDKLINGANRNGQKSDAEIFYPGMK